MALSVAGACCLVLGCLALALGAPSDSPAAAYWWQPEPVSGLIPVPGVPPNGLYVAGSPSGPQAESAVRFPVSNPTGEVQLTLHVSNQQRVGTPDIVVYPATSSWQPGGPQPWSARPSYRASTKPIQGVFSRDGNRMTITFPAVEAAIGIVLVPVTAGGQSTTFTRSFAPPQAADVQVMRGGPTQPTVTPTGSHSSHRPNPTPHSPGASGNPSSHSPHPGGPTRTSHPATTSSSPGPRPSPTGRGTPASATGSGHSSHSSVGIVIGLVVLGGVILIASGWGLARRR